MLDFQDRLPRVWRAAEAGSREKFAVEVVGATAETASVHRIAAWVFNGVEDGPRLLVCAGVHGDEYEGPRALQDLAHSLDPRGIRGTLVLVPVLNEPAMLAGTREHPDDGKNLARVFPGSAVGTSAERLAHTFVKEFLSGADFFADLHSSGAAARILPWSGYQMREGRTQEFQRRMAISFGLDIVWGTVELPGRTLSAAGDLDIPAIYVEMPGEGRCRPEDVAADRRGVMQMMSALGMNDGAFPTQRPAYFVETVEAGSGELSAAHTVAHDGVFVPEVALGDWVERGDQLGRVVDAWGEPLSVVPAEVSGCVVRLRTFPTVVVGDSVASIINIERV